MKEADVKTLRAYIKELEAIAWAVDNLLKVTRYYAFDEAARVMLIRTLKDARDFKKREMKTCRKAGEE